MILFSGDTHSFTYKFGNKCNPYTNNLTKDDFIVILGDCGFVWNGSKQDMRSLEFLNGKNCNIICICGNHENYDLIEQMPIINKFGGKVRQCVLNGETFENIFYIDFPTIIDIDEKHCLVLPKADSHDADVILNRDDPDFKQQYFHCCRNEIFFRIKHLSWWEQEKGDIFEESEFVMAHDNEYFDYILSHDCPELFNDIINSKIDSAIGPIISTPREIFFEEIRKTIHFGGWLHGHMHFKDYVYGDKYGYCCCLDPSMSEVNDTKFLTSDKIDAMLYIQKQYGDIDEDDMNDIFGGK